MIACRKSDTIRAVGWGKVRNVQHHVVGGWVQGILVKVLAHEASPFTIDFIQFAAGVPRIDDPHLLTECRDPLFEGRHETHFQSSPGRENVRRSTANDNAIAERREIFHGLAQMPHESMLTHRVQRQERLHRLLDPTYCAVRPGIPVR